MKQMPTHGMVTLGKAGSFTLLATACLTIMVGAAIAPGVKAVANGLGVSVDASWLVTLPSLGVVIFGPLAARLIMRIGCYRTLLIGLFFYGLLGVGGYFSHGWLIIANRLFLGATTVLVMAAGTGLISEFYDGAARLKMIAWQGMAIECGGVVFLFISGHLATIFWGLPFLLYILAWALLVLAWLFIPQVSLKKPHIGIISSNEIDDDGRNETTGQKSNGSVAEIYLAALVSLAVFFITVITLPRHLASFGYSESGAGTFLAFVSLVAVGAAAIMPRILRSLGDVQTLAFAFILYALGYVAFAIGTSLPFFVIGCVCIGTAFGLSVPLVNHMMIERSPVALRASHLTYLSVFIFLGQFLSSFIAMVSTYPTVIFMAGAGLSSLAAVFFILRGAFQRLPSKR